MNEDPNDYRYRLYLEAKERRQKCKAWLRQFMRPGQSRQLTKNELFQRAKSELNVTRTNFDAAWFLLIEESGRHDWHEPIRGRRNQKSPKN